jgi:hypothetical protein
VKIPIARDPRKLGGPFFGYFIANNILMPERHIRGVSISSVRGKDLSYDVESWKERPGRSARPNVIFLFPGNR